MRPFFVAGQKLFSFNQPYCHSKSPSVKSRSVNTEQPRCQTFRHTGRAGFPQAHLSFGKMKNTDKARFHWLKRMDDAPKPRDTQPYPRRIVPAKDSAIQTKWGKSVISAKFLPHNTPLVELFA